MSRSSDVVDLNVVRLARLIGAIEQLAEWCDWQARAIDDDDEAHDGPLGRDERLVLEGWCDAFGRLAADLRAVNRAETPDAPLEAARTLRSRVYAIVERCKRELDGGLDRCDTIPDLLAHQGRLHGLRVAKPRLERVAAPAGEPR